MLLIVLYFLPTIVSLLWFISFLTKKKNPSQRLYCPALGLSVAFYALYASYIVISREYPTMVRMEVVCIPLSIVAIVFLTAYFHMLYSGKRIRNLHLAVLAVPAIAEGVAILTLCYLMGFDNAADVSRQFATPEGLTGSYDTKINHLYCSFTYDVLIIMGAAYTLTSAVYCILTLVRHGYRPGNFFRFLFKGQPTVHERAIAFLYLPEILLLIPIQMLGSVYISQHVLLGVFLMTLLAALKHVIAYIEYYSDRQSVFTLDSLVHLTLNNTLQETPDAVQASSTEDDSATGITDTRIQKFEELMTVEKIWRDENLNAETICKRLGIGKTTFSQMVNLHYGMTLRELINQRRIEEAKIFMTENPGAKQEEVAEHCGFRNAQYFNTQFRKIVGLTPAAWRTGNR